jgi:hypothetical protein
MTHRVFTRAHLEASATLRRETSTWGGQIENVSLYGLFIACEHAGDLHPGQPVEVEVTLNGSASELAIRFEGSVSHVESDGVGVHVESLGVDAFVHWRNLLAYTVGDADTLEREFTRFLTRKRQAV